MSHKIPVITIDGPSGAGKGTISKMLANKLGFHFLDSGAIYRVLALHVSNLKEDVTNEDKIASIALNLPVEFKADITLNDKVVTDAIRTEDVGNTASKISVLPKVRAALLQKQRILAKLPGLIADGRDMGTVVFPNATLKIFLDASPEIRAKRRYLELREKGYSVNLGELIKEIEARDSRDRNRAVAPLAVAKDAILVDTTSLSIEEVFEKVMILAKSTLNI